MDLVEISLCTAVKFLDAVPFSEPRADKGMMVNRYGNALSQYNIPETLNMRVYVVFPHNINELSIFHI